MDNCPACGSTNLEPCSYRSSVVSGGLRRAVKDRVLRLATLVLPESLFAKHRRLRRLLSGVFSTKSMRRCPVCRLRMISPMPSADELRKYYMYFYAGEADARSFAFRENGELSSRITYLREGAGLRDIVSHLDIGGGDGSFSWLLQKQSPDTAFSIVESGVDKLTHLRQSGLFREVLDTALPVGKTYDLVSAQHVLEHLRDPLRDLQSWWDLVAPNGNLFVEVPNSNSAYHAAEGRSDLPHTFFFTGAAASHLFGRLSPKPVRVAINTGGRLWDAMDQPYPDTLASFLATGEQGCDLRVVARKP